MDRINTNVLCQLMSTHRACDGFFFINFFFQVNIVAIDVNPRACELTIRNAKNLDLDMRCLTVLNAAIQKDGKIEVKKGYDDTSKEVDFSKRKFDFIVSNPPYIPTKSVFKLQPEIKL